MKTFFSTHGSLRPCLLGTGLSMLLFNPLYGYIHYPPLIRNRFFSDFHSSLELTAKKNYDDQFGSVIANFGDSGKQNRKSSVPLYTPKSKSQKKYASFLQNPKIPLVFVLGPAGSGKTLFACMEAVTQLRRGNIQKIVITRPLVPVEEEQIGFLPGNMVTKMDPWTRPIIDIFREFYSMSDIQNMIRNGIIEISPLAFMRGRTFHRAFIIADEMQNSSPNQMMMLTTRIGMESKMVVTGDLHQSDRSFAQGNGLKDFIDKYNIYTNKDRIIQKRYNNNSYDDGIGDYHYDTENELDELNDDCIAIVQLDIKDVFRSSLVSRVLEVYHFNPSISPKSRHSDSSFDLLIDNSIEDNCNENNRTFDKTFNDCIVFPRNRIPLRDSGRPYPN